MTSISALSSNSHQSSPLQRLQDELQAEVNSGKISSSDQSALASALSDIDSAIQAGRGADSSGGAKPSPDALKSRIDDLIQGEVSNGKLTSDQAEELKGVFKASFGNGPGGAGEPPPGGPPPGGPPSADSANGSSNGTSVEDLLQQFLQSLRDSLSTSTTYGATGSSEASSVSSSSLSALLIDYQS